MNVSGYCCIESLCILPRFLKRENRSIEVKFVCFSALDRKIHDNTGITHILKADERRLFGGDSESEFTCPGKRVLYQDRISMANRDTMRQDYYWIITGAFNDNLRLPRACGK